MKDKLLKDKYLKIILMIVIVVNAYIYNPYFQIAFNTSNSLQGTIFYISKKEKPKLFSIVAFKPPIPNKTKSSMSFLKIVRGIGGDKITTKGRFVYINNFLVAYAKTQSKTGQELNIIRDSDIEPSQFYVWSPHEDSYDSRYEDIGLIDQSRVVGVAHCLF